MKKLAVLLLCFAGAATLIGVAVAPSKQPSAVRFAPRSPEWENGHTEGGALGAFLSVHSPNTPTEEQIHALATGQSVRKSFPTTSAAVAYNAGFCEGFADRWQSAQP